nr:rhomboid family intramembrane serine protease [Rathayibacter rathayi]
MAQQRATAPRTRGPLVSRVRAMTRADQPTVTYAIIALCVVLWIVEILPYVGGPAVNAMLYAPAYTLPGFGAGFEPWRMLTSVFLHSTSLFFVIPFHLVLNMYTLWVFGLVLERMLGRGRYLALFLLSGFAGSVGVLLLADPLTPVIGASGAIFGLMGAYLVILRHLGGQAQQLLVLVGLNLVIGFLPGMNVAWQAHVGGLVAGALIGLVFTRTRQRTQRRTQNMLVGLIGVGLVAITAGAYVLG